MKNISKLKSQNQDLDDLLISAHNIKMRIRLLDLDHNYKEDLSDNFIDGQVSVDGNADITRALDLTLFDPFKRIHITPDSPAPTATYIADMISVVYVVSDPLMNRVYEIPIFTGPVDDVQRDDVWLDIKALGKEKLSLANTWHAKTVKKNQSKTDAIKEILRGMVGETKLSIPDLPKKRMNNDIKIDLEDSPWKIAKNLARSMGYQLFYDGSGVATMRKMKGRSGHNFTDAWLTSPAKVSYDLTKTINAVHVIGKKKKHRPKIQYKAVAPRSHELSPWRLGRGGKPRYLWLVIEDDNIESKKEARDVARKELNHGLLAGVEVEFEGIPHPRLQELDICSVTYEGLGKEFPMAKFVIPMIAGDDASYGYLRRMRPKGGARGVKRNNRGKGKDKSRKKDRKNHQKGGHK